MELIESGKRILVIDKKNPLHEVREAVRCQNEAHDRGKVVITVWYMEQRTNYASRETRREDYAMDGHALTSSTTADSARSSPDLRSTEGRLIMH